MRFFLSNPCTIQKKAVLLQRIFRDVKNVT